jgi:hypothetical protein
MRNKSRAYGGYRNPEKRVSGRFQTILLNYSVKSSKISKGNNYVA